MKRRSLYDIVVLAGFIWLGVSALLALWSARLEANPATDPPPVSESGRPSALALPLDQQSLNAESNRFEGSEVGNPSPRGEISVQRVPLTVHGVDIRLKGTVVAGSQGLNVAIVERLGRQEICHEGDRVGQVQIQKVLRHKAIIKIDGRDELLAMEFQKNSSDAPTSKLQGKDGQQPASNAYPPIRLDRAELASSFEDLHKLMKSVRIHRYKEGKEQGGFLVTSIKPGSLLAKMGLRNGDMIIGVNDESVTRVQQATDFYKALVEGGYLSLEIKRRGHPQTLQFEIQ